MSDTLDQLIWNVESSKANLAEAKRYLAEAEKNLIDSGFVVMKEEGLENNDTTNYKLAITNNLDRKFDYKLWEDLVPHNFPEHLDPFTVQPRAVEVKLDLTKVRILEKMPEYAELLSEVFKVKAKKPSIKISRITEN